MDPSARSSAPAAWPFHKMPFLSLLPLLLDSSEYLGFYQLLQDLSLSLPPSQLAFVLLSPATTLAVAAPFSIAKPNSDEDFFKRARERGSESHPDIVSDGEVKKNFSRGRKIITVAP
jgi:hypothetical protein